MERNIEFVQKMIELTIKKQEALEYLYSLLAEDQVVHEMPYRQWYYNRKKKIESAILKVDIEFLEVYHELLDQEKVKTIGELPKDRFGLIKLLQDEIAKAKDLESKIKDGESALMDEEGSHKVINRVKASKHLAPRAVEAYKKIKK